MKREAVMFDMDGVIVDTEHMHQAAFQATMDAFGYELTELDFINHFNGRTHENGLARYFSHTQSTADVQAILRAKNDNFLAIAREGLTPHEDVVELIWSLAGTVPMALVTGSSRAVIELVITTCGLEDCFSALVGFEDITHPKPSPDGYQKAMALLKTPPEQCVVVDDTPSGISAGIATGALCIAITSTHAAADLTEASEVVDMSGLGALLEACLGRHDCGDAPNPASR